MIDIDIDIHINERNLEVKLTTYGKKESAEKESAKKGSIETRRRIAKRKKIHETLFDSLFF